MYDNPYVHGYSPREAERLRDQADTLSALLHFDTGYPSGSRVLEAGCGVGAQTLTLARKSPNARILAVDRCEASLLEAKRRALAANIQNVEFLQADILALDLGPARFDHVFLCFVLEHVPKPVDLLRKLVALLKPGGTICAIEGDHGSTLFYPDCQDSHRAIECLVELQRQSGGDPHIGRRLHPLFLEAGLVAPVVSPRLVYADASRPELVNGFTLNTFAAMVDGVGESAVARGLIDRECFERGLAGLRRCAEPDGVFCYTFFKATGKKAQ